MAELAIDVKGVVEKAQKIAAMVTREWLATHGDMDCCGFAWVTAYEVKGNTKLGRGLKAAGFDKAYGGGLQWWNPSGSNTQCITAKEKGAEAAAKFLTDELGVKFYANSRMD